MLLKWKENVLRTVFSQVFSLKKGFVGSCFQSAKFHTPHLSQMTMQGEFWGINLLKFKMITTLISCTVRLKKKGDQENRFQPTEYFKYQTGIWTLIIRLEQKLRTVVVFVVAKRWVAWIWRMERGDLVRKLNTVICPTRQLDTRSSGWKKTWEVKLRLIWSYGAATVLLTRWRQSPKIKFKKQSTY